MCCCVYFTPVSRQGIFFGVGEDFAVNILYKNADVYGFGKSDILTSGSVIIDISADISETAADNVVRLDGMSVFPGFADVHVHFREPGFSYKETVYCASRAAARGGFTAVCTMPNLNPVPDCIENLAVQTEIIKRDSVIDIVPFGSITKNEDGREISDMDSLAPHVAGFSDDGRGVQSEEVMRRAMENAARLGKVISAHCEDESLLCGGCVHDGGFAKKNSLVTISSESEYKPIARDIGLSEQIGCAYHVCHVSAKESVDIIRSAKQRGADVTCETAPHYLVLCNDEIRDSGNFRMNPPIRAARDRDALIDALRDGTVDIIATDHAPHSAEEKSGGIQNSLNGIVGLETAFPVLYTCLVRSGKITLDCLVRAMNENPRKRFGVGGVLQKGEKADFTVFDLNRGYRIDSSEFLSKGKSTPFEGRNVYGRCIMTVCGGKIVWRDKE